ncbi:TetR/AcrR family transcriptional regulator [Curtobacterium sp. VKM Ac-2887]|uniref:TetR/AcrR family transcriptional regulator n=1 Tax=Curtobacterium sp. VKM Ac-2887 TaxID=2783819 RepID=UPI00188C583E|nr:TetR/AcrR family transcriptional regulator [Curtobacterium sp. VKM Ac-2887]MBF4585673.1 TetR family transcriptional regulator [Curtobacterium sp. VKM Ac-2887]
MPRSGAAARQRLYEAALALYTERGYDATTTADIAQRAGVNDRTYFRHFPDKREVLFDGQGRLRDALVAAVHAVPSGTSAIKALRAAFIDAAGLLEDDRAAGISRLRIIADTPALLERDLAKGADMAAALAGALRDRGEHHDVADLIATVCWATFHHAASQWIGDGTRGLRDHITDAFQLLTATVSRAGQAH